MIDGYILCSSPRSGATLLTNMLRDSGVAGWPGAYVRGAGMRARLHSMEAEVPGDVTAAELARDGYRLARAKGTRDGIFALRLQPSSLATFRLALKALQPDQPNDAARIAADMGRHRVIYLRRADLLGRAVSMLRTLQTGYWYEDAEGNETDGTAPDSIPVYDRIAIAEKMEQFAEMDAAWESWFASEGIEPILLEYDDLAADPEGVLARLLTDLGLDPAAAEGAAPAPEHVPDAGDDESRDWIRRFQQDTMA
ncbi:Stf0 sulfotransferase family protein [Ferrimonas balearica]|nr:Stf0 sulfotransferase family protein [Ferrimonas balearica]